MRANHVPRPAVLTASAFCLVAALAPAPVAAQALKHPSASVTVLEDPATAAFRKALSSVSPALAAATRWQQSQQDATGAETASSVAIDVPWNESRILAEKLTIGPRAVTLQGVRFENGKGTFDADTITGPVDAFRSLVAFAFAEGPAKPAMSPPADEPLRITNFRLSAKQDQRGTARFSSSWTGGSLVVRGLRCVGGKEPLHGCDFLVVAGLHAKALDARSTFAGTAEMQIGSFAFDLNGEGSDRWSGLKQLASYFARPLDSAGESIGADFSMENLHLLATRNAGSSGAQPPAQIDVANADLSLERGSSGDLRVKGSLSSSLSPNVARGTSIWPAIEEKTRGSGQASSGLLPLSARIESSYGAGHLSLAKLAANVAGLFDLDASADVTGLEGIADHKSAAGDPAGKQGLTVLMGIAVRSFSLVMHDNGLSDLVETAFHASPGELLREAAGLPPPGDSAATSGKNAVPSAGSLMSLMTGGGDMRSGLRTIIRKAAVERLAGILDQLRKDGKVELHCTSTPACISLAIRSTD